MSPQDSYWEDKIIEWEDSMRGEQKNVSPLERLAARFREPLKVRAGRCMDLLAPRADGKRLVELGCGSGFFAMELAERTKVEHITAIDISSRAVERATAIAAERGLTDRVTFQHADGNELQLPDADITYGLGFLDYLSPDELHALFQKIRSEHVLFTFSEKRLSFYRALHIVYLKIQNCTKHFYYTRDEILAGVSDRAAAIRFLSGRDMMFGCIFHDFGEG
jgi:SAM-dependent methyltransferase